MAETLALAVGVPAALAAACLASRRSWSPAYADNRGIALQTVIVIVVMLVIAGGVAGVLLARGADVQADLEAQQVSGFDDATSNAGTCETVGRSLLTRSGFSGTPMFTAGTTAANAIGDINYNSGSCTIFVTAGSITTTDCEQASSGGTGSLTNGSQLCTIA